MLVLAKMLFQYVFKEFQGPSEMTTRDHALISIAHPKVQSDSS